MQTVTELAGAPHGAPVVVFAHANGYPPESYRLLLENLSQHFQVFTVEHRPLWSEDPPPKRLDWSVYADDLLATLDARFPEPVWLVGHSMGAVVSMLVAAQAPERVRGLVAFDPVLIPLRHSLSMQFMTRVLRRDIPIAQVALKRPHHFDDVQAAFDFYRGKRPFAGLSDEALMDYVCAGHGVDAQGRASLRWSGAWEACVYRSAPSVIGRLRRLTLPMLGVAGATSNVLSHAVLSRWQVSVPQLELHVLPGGHLIPLESPDQCAVLAEGFINRHQ